MSIRKYLFGDMFLVQRESASIQLLIGAAILLLATGRKFVSLHLNLFNTFKDTFLPDEI